MRRQKLKMNYTKMRRGSLERERERGIEQKYASFQTNDLSTKYYENESGVATPTYKSILLFILQKNNKKEIESELQASERTEMTSIQRYITPEHNI